MCVTDCSLHLLNLLLDLKWNSIGVIGGRELLSSLKLNTHLEELHLAGNNVTNDILEAIGTATVIKYRVWFLSCRLLTIILKLRH